MAYVRRRLTKGKPKVKSTRRRLQPAAAIALAGAALVKKGIGRYQKAKITARRVAASKVRARFRNRVEASDNIVTAPTVSIGTQKQPSFNEKVALSIRPPLSFKRNYQFSAECGSGRKGWFSMNINTMDSNDLLTDITTYKTAMTTDTATGDTTLNAAGLNDNAQFYIDSHKEYIQMSNSSSNSITGKIHLYCHKRDTDSSYDGAGISPVNLMMYYTANSTSSNVAPAGGVTGFGFTNTGASSTGYQTVFNMPGSSINSAQLQCASTDLSLSPDSSYIRDRMSFWFRRISSSSFSLKPGQQFNISYILHLDNKKIVRELQKFVHIAGVSYNIVVEFQAGIVGDNTVANSVSTGTGQLSIIRSNTRVLGLVNKLRPKILLQTANLTDIANANQVIINNDTGIQDIGVDLDA